MGEVQSIGEWSNMVQVGEEIESDHGALGVLDEQLEVQAVVQ